MKELIRPAGEVLLKFLESEQGRKALGKTAEAGMAAAKVAGEGLGKFGLRSLVLGLGSWVLGLGSWVFGLGSLTLGLGSLVLGGSVSPSQSHLPIPSPIHCS